MKFWRGVKKSHILWEAQGIVPMGAGKDLCREIRGVSRNLTPPFQQKQVEISAGKTPPKFIWRVIGAISNNFQAAFHQLKPPNTPGQLLIASSITSFKHYRPGKPVLAVESRWMPPIIAAANRPLVFDPHPSKPALMDFDLQP